MTGSMDGRRRTAGLRQATGRRRTTGWRWGLFPLLGALALVLVSGVRAQQAPETRHLQVEVLTPDASEAATWHFFQGPAGITMVPPRQPPHPLNAWALVEPGGEPLVVQAERERLVPVWESREEYREGVEVDGRSSTLVLRDLNWDMIRGSADRTVAGRSTRHYVITASIKMVAHPMKGLEKLGEDSTVVTSRTDVWIDPSLPFSWAPFAVWGARSLVLGHPVADAHLRREVGPELAGLGLPLRTQSRVTYRELGDADIIFGQDARTELVVTEIQPAESPAVPPRFLRYSRSSASQ